MLDIRTVTDAMIVKTFSSRTCVGVTRDGLPFAGFSSLFDEAVYSCTIVGNVVTMKCDIIPVFYALDLDKNQHIQNSSELSRYREDARKKVYERWKEFVFSHESNGELCSAAAEAEAFSKYLEDICFFCSDYVIIGHEVRINGK